MAPRAQRCHTARMKIDPAARMNLMRFVCSFVWTDLKVAQAERDLVMRIAGRLGLGNDEVKQVAAWLKVPPPADDIDPTTVPIAHRQLFLQAAELAVQADGRVVPAEREALALFRDLVAE
jgi:hypothetical protein